MEVVLDDLHGPFTLQLKNSCPLLDPEHRLLQTCHSLTFARLTKSLMSILYVAQNHS